MMRFSLLVHTIIFIAFHIFGTAIQVNRLLDKNSKSMLTNGLDFSAFFESPLPLYLLQYLVIFILLTYLFIVSQSYFSLIFASKIKPYINNDKARILIWAIISNCALFIANAAWFKHSLHLSDIFYLWQFKHLNTYLCLLIVTIPLFFFTAKHLHLKSIKVLTATTIILSIAFNITSNKEDEAADINLKQPHVIFIGIDSLRNDLLLTHMPFLSTQLKDAVIFDNAITPLGRTYPAWNTILTGQYPITHGARINLISNEFIAKPNQFLGNVLKEEGYRSIFAIDETRFANIGKHHGFDQVISPRTGASDFIIHTFSDFPLTNLLSLLPISSWLLPEIYGNRGAAATYRAEAFSDILERELPAANKPTFLAAHFCLAHWPYFFSTKYIPEWGYPEPYYPANLKAVDDQLKAFFKDLDQKGYLENSKIVFLSDHGEAWPSESPKFTNSNLTDKDSLEHAPKIYGHGSTLTSNNNRVIIAFKNFDDSDLNKNIHKITSLADIAPTIYEELNLSPKLKFDGKSLLDVDLQLDRDIPIETGTIITVTEDNQLNVNELVSSMLDRYQLNPNGLITIQSEKAPDAIKAKNKGIFKGNQILAQYQQSQFRLFNLNTYEFEHFDNFEILQSKRSNWSQLWCKWYKNEDGRCITTIDH